jgi:ankyrin repeat protein
MAVQKQVTRFGCLLASVTAASLAMALVVRVASALRADDFVHAGSMGDTAAMARMLKHGVSVNAQDAFYGDTALHRACRRSRREAVRTLLAAGADPNIVNAAGMTPLMETARAGDAEIARMLLDHGGAPAVLFDGRRSAADLAEISDHPEVARLLRTRSVRRPGSVQPPPSPPATP